MGEGKVGGIFENLQKKCQSILSFLTGNAAQIRWEISSYQRFRWDRSNRFDVNQSTTSQLLSNTYLSCDMRCHDVTSKQCNAQEDSQD